MRRFLAAAILLCYYLIVNADGSKSLALELLLAAKSDELISMQLKSMEELQIQHIDKMIKDVSYTQPAVNADSAKTLAKFREFKSQMGGIIKKFLNWENISPHMVDIYASTYTDAEMKGFLKFYETELGQEVVTHQSMILQKTNQVLDKIVQQMLPEMMTLAKRIRDGDGSKLLNPVQGQRPVRVNLRGSQSQQRQITRPTGLNGAPHARVF